MPTLKLTYADGESVEVDLNPGEMIQVTEATGIGLGAKIKAAFATDGLEASEISTPAAPTAAPVEAPVEPEHGLDADPADEAPAESQA